MGMRRATIAAAILLAAGCLVLLTFLDVHASDRRRAVSPGAPRIGPPSAVRLGTIPSDAEIVFHRDELIYVMGRQRATVTQITFDHPRRWEHVAVSHDRRFVVANEQLPNPTGEAGGMSRRRIFDLAAGIEARLLPQFLTAGNASVDCDTRRYNDSATK